jgi:hypothetical protein
MELLKFGLPGDAEPVLRECLAIRLQKEPDAWTTFNTKSMLGAALLGQKKYADAEPLLLAGYEGMTQRAAKIPPQGQVRLTEALEQLVQFYDDSGEPKKAAELRQKKNVHEAVDPAIPDCMPDFEMLHRAPCIAPGANSREANRVSPHGVAPLTVL